MSLVRVVKARLVTTVDSAKARVKPLPTPSLLRYLVPVLPSMMLLTPSPAGLLAEEAVTETMFTD